MSHAATAAVVDWGRSALEGWNRFWFTPSLPHTLCLIRIATGAMLLYTHLVLAKDFSAFVGPDAWIDNTTARALHDGTFGTADWGRSYLWHVESRGLLWAHHGVTLVVMAMLMVGLATRIVAPLAWLLQLMYVHRLTGTLFGLDQITTMLAMYLMLAPCGAVFSLDALWRRRWIAARHRRGDSTVPTGWFAWLLPEARPSVAANVATRLAQLHLCVIYLFGGLWKARGEMWWDGTAMWFAVANQEYQSLDLTWLARYPVLFSAATHLTIFWEVFYCALVWPRLTRPLVLLLAVMVHGGIALGLGMVTFGVMMIVANAIFVQPELVERITSRRREPDDAGVEREKRVEVSNSVDSTEKLMTEI